MSRALAVALKGLLAAIGAVVVLMPAPALAHARVVASQPAAGSSVRGPVTQVTVTFDEPVELVPRALTVTTDLGVPVAVGHARLVNRNRLVSVVQDRLAAGGYRVAWRVEADDGHIETGTFTFSVVGDLAPAATTPAAATRPPTPDQPVWPVLVSAGVALAAAIGAALVVRRGLRFTGASAHATQSRDT